MPQRRAARMARIVIAQQEKCVHMDSFDVFCSASCFDLFGTDAHILYKGLIELDQTLILPALPLIAIESVSLSKILTLLTTIEDEFDSLSLYRNCFSLLQFDLPLGRLLIGQK